MRVKFAQSLLLENMTSEDNAFELKERLLDKSIEAYVLSLETINRLTIQYRLETFCYLLCNAWELLLKAKLIEDAGNDDAAYYPNSSDGEKRSFSLVDCLNRLLPNQNDPVRRNIDRIRELRDESVHLVIAEIPSDVIALLQAGVTNYYGLLNEWFEESLANRYPVPMMSIVFDLEPDRHDLSNARLRSRLGQDAFGYLSRFSAELASDHEALGYSEEFLVTIRYGVYLTRREADADISLTSGPSDSESTQVVEVPKDPSLTHPIRFNEVIETIKEFYPTANQHDVHSINAVFRVKSRHQWFYRGKVKGSPGQYSQDFVDWIRARHEQNPGFFTETRKKGKALDGQRSAPYTAVLRTP